MRCPKCNSENVQIQSQEYKPKITLWCCLAVGGFGMMFLGIFGAVIGVLLGLLISAILHASIPTAYRSVVVCQNCGFVGTSEAAVRSASNPVFSTSGESNVIIVRKSASVGSVCALGIKIDNSAPFSINDGEVKYLKLGSGLHKLTYYQINGMGKKKRNGTANIVVGDNKKVVEITFLPKGLCLSEREIQT